VWRPAGGCLEGLNRALDPLPHEPPVNITAIKHQIGTACGLDLRIGTVAFQGKTRCGPHFAVGNRHGVGKTYLFAGM
jgi:hypothetical protein